jgi:hypothetical protein
MFWFYGAIDHSRELTMNMNCTASIMARNDGLESNGAIVSGDLDTPQRLTLKICRVFWIAIHATDHATIHTGCISRPNLDRDVFERFASIHIHYLNVQIQVNTLLAISNILANVLALNI